MPAIANNTAQLLEEDPRLRIVKRFLEDVMHVQNVERLSFSLRQSTSSQWLQSLNQSVRPEWEVSASVPGLDGKMIFLVEQLVAYQIASVAFFPGWQPEDKP